MGSMDYLQRPLLQDVNFIITDETVTVTGPSTIYCKVEKYKSIVQKDLLQLYSNILKKSREKKEAGYDIKISYKRGYKKFITTNWESYTESCKRLDTLYDALKKQALIVQKRGLHMGTDDDIELKKMVKISWEINKMFNRDTIISKMSELVHLFSSLYAMADGVGANNCVGCTVYL